MQHWVSRDYVFGDSDLWAFYLFLRLDCFSQWILEVGFLDHIKELVDPTACLRPLLTCEEANVLFHGKEEGSN